MKQRLTYALMMGGVVGALFGFLEAAVLLSKASRWALDTFPLSVAMGVYGFLNAVLTGVWGIFACRMNPQAFQKRTLFFSLLAMTFLFGGFYLNQFWFPEIQSRLSLLFTFLWTSIFVGAVLRLLKSRTQGTSSLPPPTWLRGLQITLAGLIVVAGFLTLPTLSKNRLHSMESDTPSVKSDRPNILLIVMDTTRADRFSSYGYPRETTPNLDRLAAEGVLFENASAPAPWTLPSHASLFTGLYPSQHGAQWGHERLDEHLTTIAELLRDNGYQTVGFTNNPWVGRSVNFDQGFDYFSESWLGGRFIIERLAIFHLLDKFFGISFRSKDAGAEWTNRNIRRWFREAHHPRRPFFIFINFLEAHFNYEPPEPYRSRFLRPENRDAKGTIERNHLKKLRRLRRTAPPVNFDEKTKEILSDLYDGEIAYLDMRIGELLEDLKKRGLLDNTVVIVTSDHGENIDDHDIFGHHFSVHQTLLNIPLIMRYPKELPAGVRVKEPASLVDVMPTLLKLLKLEAPDFAAVLPGHSWVGSSLALPRERIVLSEYAAPLPLLPKFKVKQQVIDEQYFKRSLRSISKGNFKFIWASDGKRELYDLGQDPKESQNLIEKFPDKAREMEKKLKNQIDSLKTLGPLEEVGELDETTRDELRALGYLQ